MYLTRRADYPAVISYFDDFRGPNPYAFLSNFYRSGPLTWEGYEFATGEHLFQAFKATTVKEFNKIRLSLDPNTSKARGRATPLRADWNMVKYDVMRLVLALKFTLDRPEGAALLDTGDALLVEGTEWRDDVWGVDLADRRDGPTWARYGRNWLGVLLMARRAELRAEHYFGAAPDYRAVFDHILPPWMAVEAAKANAAVREVWAEPKTRASDLLWATVDVAIDDDLAALDDDDPDLVTWMAGHDLSIDDALEAARDAPVRTGPTLRPDGKLDHSGCDHAASKGARRRCRTAHRRVIR